MLQPATENSKRLDQPDYGWGADGCGWSKVVGKQRPQLAVTQQSLLHLCFRYALAKRAFDKL
jgi:hypothetical protein